MMAVTSKCEKVVEVKKSVNPTELKGILDYSDG
jgi:hypothetical protein